MYIKLTDNGLQLKISRPEESQMLIALASALIAYDRIMNPSLETVPHSTLAHERTPGLVRLNPAPLFREEEPQYEKNLSEMQQTTYDGEKA